MVAPPSATQRRKFRRFRIAFQMGSTASGAPPPPGLVEHTSEEMFDERSPLRCPGEPHLLGGVYEPVRTLGGQSSPSAPHLLHPQGTVGSSLGAVEASETAHLHSLGAELASEEMKHNEMITTAAIQLNGLVLGHSSDDDWQTGTDHADSSDDERILDEATAEGIALEHASQPMPSQED